MEAVNLLEKFGKFSDYWHPYIVAESNGQHIRLAKLKGEFVWHKHDQEDELFIVVKGNLTVKFRDREVAVREGELFVVPRGVEHCPVAEEDVYLINITNAETTHTGSVKSDITVGIEEMERI